jgi:virulence-associated protein VagC
VILFPAGATPVHVPFDVEESAGSILLYMSTTVQPLSEFSTTAELFTTEDGRQAVRLPADVHIEGDSVRIRKVSGGILLESGKKPMTREEVRAMFTRIDSYGGDPLFPDGRNQGVREPENLFD